MFALRMAALVAATLSTGVIAGLFYGYANSVMPALGQTDDRVIIDVMQRINVIIVNPLFMLAFMGTVGFTVLAAALHLGKDSRTTLLWIGIALVLNVIAFAVTSGLNVPLNNQLAAAGDPAQIGDLAAVRAQFETSWVRWNIVRAVLHTLAFAVLIGALFVAGVQHGKANAAGTAVASGPVASGSVSDGPAFQQSRGGFAAPVTQQRFAPAAPGFAPLPQQGYGRQY
ncbi:anthrone oxygenase family protein [Nocardia sp. NPDC052001]|uniref:anthrone oxygenase family protein n=1 Tax=Nocardia sp. NPDC052001 TaxID=3154853 RepID=UPI003434FE52